MLFRYKVVAGSTTKQLTQAVNKELRDGWEPLGGLCFDGNEYTQALQHCFRSIEELQTHDLKSGQ